MEKVLIEPGKVHDLIEVTETPDGICGCFQKLQAGPDLEMPEAFKTRADGFDEEEVFVRCGIFKKEIPKIYNYTCCISGMRIIAGDIQMIDACHIIPFSESHDDTITNGLSLCPNLHRAFDRGIISISDDYRVLIKEFSENQDTLYSIKQFEGKEILLPKEKIFRPSAQNLFHHRQRFGFSAG